MAKPAILQVTTVRKIYHAGGIFSRKKLVAVDGVSLTLDEKPQVFSIVGGSGSGKTTLARMILRLVEDDVVVLRERTESAARISPFQ